MRLFSAMEISASGLTAERFRLDLIASNLANAQSTRTETGGPYRRKIAAFAPRGARYSFSQILSRRTGEGPKGVAVTGVLEDKSPFNLVHMPGHPDADEQGYVAFPNVDVVTEMVDLMAATRAYEANVTAIEAARLMAQRALEILKT